MPESNRAGLTTFAATGSSQDSVAIPKVWFAFALSLLLHALLLWSWGQKDPLLPFNDEKKGKPTGSLAVHLAPQPARRTESAPPPSPASPASRATQPQHAAKAAPRAKPDTAAPRVLAQDRPGAAAAPPSQSVPGDLASYIESRRRARESAPSAPSPARPPSPPAESQQERDNRQAAENLGLNRTPNFGAEKKLGGGIFQVQRMGYDSAEFFFFGYNRLIRRNARQMIEVRRGDSPSMEVAVVRKMIAIIREHTTEDFLWESQRLGREVALSARPADNAGLETFMLSEFFPDYRRR